MPSMKPRGRQYRRSKLKKHAAKSPKPLRGGSDIRQRMADARAHEQISRMHEARWDYVGGEEQYRRADKAYKYATA